MPLGGEDYRNRARLPGLIGLKLALLPIYGISAGHYVSNAGVPHSDNGLFAIALDRESNTHPGMACSITLRGKRSRSLR
ncbi:MAG: hypothetical protein ACREYE_15950 [Gammaproteobacteria bacterium]